MSQSLASVIQARSDNFTMTSVSIAALALLIFDTLITLPTEIRYIWCKNVKIGTILYILARYPSMVLLLIDLYNHFPGVSLQTCNDLTRLVGVLYIPIWAGMQGLLLARAYAISAQNKIVLGVLGPLSLGVLITQAYMCIISRCPTSGPQNTWTLLNTIIDIDEILIETGDVIVLILSTIETLMLWNKGESWDKESLMNLLIYQGFIGFGFALTTSLATAITSRVLRPSLSLIVVILQMSLIPIIICRFHLTLQARHDRLNSPASLPTISFASFRAATQSVHDNIRVEFGNPPLSRSRIAETWEDETDTQENRQSTEEIGASGYTGNVDTAGTSVSRPEHMAEA